MPKLTICFLFSLLFFQFFLSGSFSIAETPGTISSGESTLQLAKNQDEPHLVSQESSDNSSANVTESSSDKAEPSIESDLKDQERKQENVLKQIETEKKEAETNKAEAEKLAASAQKAKDKASNQQEKNLASFLLEVQNYRTELSELRLQRAKEINAQIENINIRTNALRQYEKKLTNSPLSIVDSDLENASKIWRSVVDDSSKNLFAAQSMNLRTIPILSGDIDLEKVKEKELVDEINDSLTAAEEEKLALEQNISDLQRAHRDVLAKLLLIAGRIRSDLMNSLIKADRYSVWNVHSDYFSDIVREVQIVPYRFVATFIDKFQQLKLLSKQGPKGWIEIVKQLTFIALFFSLPFFLFSLFKKISNYLDRFRKDVFSWSSIDFSRRTKIAFWLGRINPYLPWIFALLAIQLTRFLLEGTVFTPILVVLAYISIYTLYRVFRLWLSTILARVLLSRNLEKVRSKKDLVYQTAKRMSILFFSQWAFLHAIQDAVRQALIYNLVFDTVIFFNLFVLSHETAKWREELLELSKQWLSPKLQAKLLSSPGSASSHLYSPFLFLGNTFYLLAGWFYNWIGQFEFGKKISSEIFKKRLQDAIEKKDLSKVPLDKGYVDLFTDDCKGEKDVDIDVTNSSLDQAVKSIDMWKEGKSNEDLLLISGNYGSGKSTTLRKLKNKYNQCLEIKEISLKKKIITSIQFFEMLSELLGTKVEKTSDLEKLDREIEKTLVIIDDIHYLYLNTDSGLAAYRMLIESTSMQLENIFWCLSCDARALDHLNGLFGKGHFLGECIEFVGWSDVEIQNLIMKRHRLSKYPLVFDQVISAVHKGDILESASDIEVQFFRLLWRQSRGNPKTAIELWLSSAYLNKHGSIRISVPQFIDSKVLAELADETSMVYAALAKHESLSFNQLRTVCDLPRSTMKQALKYGEDIQIIEKVTKSKWRIHPRALHLVHSHLSGRNMIHG